MPAVRVQPLSRAAVVFSGRAEGDLGSARERGPAGPSAEVRRRRRELVDREWTWLRQVHGADVVTVCSPGDQAGAEADAAVTAHPEAALAVLTADCAPVALSSPEGVVGIAHAGWRGLAAGVIERTAAAMRELGATTVEAALGPCIHAECYEFSEPDLRRVAAVLGDGVRGRSAGGAPALDLPAAVRLSLAQAGVALVHDDDLCTACAVDRCFSHRARGEAERQATVVWPT